MPAVLLALTAGLTFAVLTGVPLTEVLALTGAVAGTQILPGALLWRLVRPREGSALEDLAVGFALGTVISVPVAVVAGLTGQRWLAIALPAVLVVGLLALPRSRHRILSAGWVRLPAWFGAGLALTSLSAWAPLMLFAARQPVRWQGVVFPGMDTYIHQALASQILTRGPGSWPTVLGEDLGYHWFAHAWMAQVAAASGGELNHIVIRFLPVIIGPLMAASIGVTVLRLAGGTRRAAAGTGVLASALAFLAAGWVPYGYGEGFASGLAFPIAYDSPTLGLGAPTMLTLIVVIVLRWRAEMQGWASWGLVLVLAVTAAGTKGSTVPLVLVGLSLALLAALIWQRALVRAVLLDIATLTGALVAVMAVVFHWSSAGLTAGIGAAAGQTMLALRLDEQDPRLGQVLLPGPHTAYVLVAATVMMALSRVAAGGILLLDAARRRDLLTWLLLGVSCAGAGGVAVFSHPGKSQYYFLMSAFPVMAIASAMGLAALWGQQRPRERGITLGLAVVGALAAHFVPPFVVGPVARKTWSVVWQAPIIGGLVLLAVGAVAWWLRPAPKAAAAISTVLAAVTLSGVVTFVQGFNLERTARKGHVSTQSPGATTMAQTDAARWIRDHSDRHDLVMTNRHCVHPVTPASLCDSRRWVVTAFSERQLLIEGWTTTPRASREAPLGRLSLTVPYWNPERLALNDSFYTAPTAEAARRLWDLGVRWVFVDRVLPSVDLAPFAVLRLENADAQVWQLNQP